MTGSQLRRERERLGISRAEVAAAVGVSDAEVADWERRDAPVPAHARRRIASRLSAERERHVVRPSSVVAGSRAGGAFLDLLATFRGTSLALVAGGVVASLLGLARLLRHLPYHELVKLAIYPFAFLLAAVVGVGLYVGLAPLRRGAVGRWIARFVACTGAMVAWVSPFLVSGYDRIGRKSRHVGWEDAIELALVAGLVLASLWPLAEGSTDDP